jgi:hypothetical protein
MSEFTDWILNGRFAPKNFGFRIRHVGLKIMNIVGATQSGETLGPRRNVMGIGSPADM